MKSARHLGIFYLLALLLLGLLLWTASYLWFTTYLITPSPVWLVDEVLTELPWTARLEHLNYRCGEDKSAYFTHSFG